jgi:Cu(I)/Ag(I) efflux system membrane fusion protein
MKKVKPIIFIIIALVAGFLIRGCFTSPPHGPSSRLPAPSAQPEIWTCSMHPQIQLPKAGKCPICFMDLIPLESGSDAGGEREISVSPYAAKLMELETAEVVRRFVAAEVRMVGKVDYDETRVTYISAWVPGRIDRLFVDYTGIPVKKGDHLAELYSPELLTAQEELIQAVQTLENLKNSQSSMLLDTAKQTIEAVREKLRLWGFTVEQIAKIESSGGPSDHMTIYSPTGGIVIHKNAKEGQYVQTGTQIYTIADLSRVWIQLDAYESDLNWLRYGSNVEFTTEAYPGKTFRGTISFIDPIINPATRTAKVRVIVENPAMDLKPGMFVRAIARPEIAEDGRVMNPALAGKWISPMHPEVVKDEPGACDVCGMPLVTAESLGYVNENEENAPLVIPVTAALKTGKRAIVYVEITDREKPTYEGREVELGARLGDFYVVSSGLDEGERVVTRGAFKLDAELQIHAKPSMMSMPSEQTEESKQPTADNQQLKPQTLCPVMGGEINRDVFTDYNGMRIYFCCPSCDAEFKADPEKYLKQMRDAGVEPEQLAKPQTLCPVMGGEINKEIYTDYNGMRIYFCCAGCDGEFKADPEKYIAQMRENGVEPEMMDEHHAH